MQDIKFSIFSIWSLFFAIAFLAIGYGAVLSFVGVYLKQQGSSDLSIGIINAAFFLGAILSATFSHKIISTIGHIRSFAVFASCMVISFLTHILIFNELIWGILRLIAGFSFYALLIILESWLNEKSSGTNRGRVLAVYSIVFYLAMSCGQMLLNIEGIYEYFIFTVSSVSILCSVVFISMTKIEQPILKKYDSAGFPRLYSIIPLALVGSYIAGFLVGGFFTMMPVYIYDVYSSLEIVSFFMISTLLGGLVSQWPIGMLSDKYGRRKLIAFCGFFSAVVSFLFLVIPSKDVGVYIFGFLFGVSIFPIYSLSLARANDVLYENSDMLEISRGLLFTYGLGSFSAPLLLGIMQGVYENMIFVVYVLLGSFLGYFALSQKRVNDDEMSFFVNVPGASSSVLSELDPRSN